MLTILVCSSKDFEEFFPDCNRLSFMADFLLALHCVSRSFEPAGILTSASLGSLGRRANIFFTQNLQLLARRSSRATVSVLTGTVPTRQSWSSCRSKLSGCWQRDEHGSKPCPAFWVTDLQHSLRTLVSGCPTKGKLISPFHELIKLFDIWVPFERWNHWL